MVNGCENKKKDTIYKENSKVCAIIVVSKPL
jgi:hypothetical protein